MTKLHMLADTLGRPLRFHVMSRHGSPATSVLQSYDDTVDHCFRAWNKLTDQPWHIVSIRLRNELRSS